MHWVQSEYLLKGIFLGLLGFVALQKPTWEELGSVALGPIGGLLLAFLIGRIRQFRSRERFRGSPAAMAIYLLLEYPSLVFAGVILGLFGSALMIREGEPNSLLLAATVGGGGLLGVAFYLFPILHDPKYRLGVGLVIPAVLLGGGFLLLEEYGLLDLDQRLIGACILLGLPFYWLLNFCGMAEESEVEVAAGCVALAGGLWLTGFFQGMPSIPLVVPAMFYFFYVLRVLPGLRVFKYILRGHSYLNLSRYRTALLAFRRALQLEPKSRAAREGLWLVHRSIDLDKIGDDIATLNLLDLRLCIDRAAMLLCGEHPPRPNEFDEAERLLALVERQWSNARAVVAYYRVVALTHRKRFEEAEQLLRNLLDPSAWPADDERRLSILLSAWLLALQQHPELSRRIGPAALALPGRRMEAIAVVERHLRAVPDDEPVIDLRRRLYGSLTEAEYLAALRDNQPPTDFDHAYTESLGLALIDDPIRRERGMEYLRIAARGLPARGPSIFAKLSAAAGAAGDLDAARSYRDQVKRSGLAYGPKALAPDQREIFFAKVKESAEAATVANDLAAAIADWSLYEQYERSGIETMRALADLYARSGDPLNALRVCEKGLAFNGKDKDLLAKKDSYYYSVTPEQLRTQLDEVRKYFDTTYCLRKARLILDTPDTDLDSIDWAAHLIELARLFDAKNLSVMTLDARCKLRRGEREAALSLLEDVREAKPSTSDEEDSWYWTCRTLGRIYLDELNRPDLAVHAFLDFKKSPKSGADTIYHLGRAYEALGDTARAKRCYEQVTAYESHPLRFDAEEALRRLKATA